MYYFMVEENEYDEWPEDVPEAAIMSVEANNMQDALKLFDKSKYAKSLYVKAVLDEEAMCSIRGLADSFCVVTEQSPIPFIVIPL